MKPWLITLAILAGIPGLATGAEAQNLPWCAHLDYGADEAVTCTFTSFEECLSLIHGVGGFCMANNTYQPPLSAAPSHRPKKRGPLKPS